ncbi:TPA: aryl-sulfate sulfotransferase [Providencia alcalifaciens]
MMGMPSIYPTKTTIYKPDKAWNGYTLFSVANKGAVLIDMNGNEVHVWQDSNGVPCKMLPRGNLLSYEWSKEGDKYREYTRLVQRDWDNNEVWSFDRVELLTDDDGEQYWSARAHHDFQREGNPVGYYTPDLISPIYEGKTLLLCHRNIQNPQISDKPLLDDVFVEVNWQGNIVWTWALSDHFSELGFSETAKNVFYRNPNLISDGVGDYLHINSLSRLGPNKHYDNGNTDFHPENIIWSSREANIIGITSRETRKIVWQIGPDYTHDNVKHLGGIIGQHHAHLIPQGLPGAGNILLFDNGWQAGYGQATPTSLYGLKNACRDYSRVLEIDPISLDIVWQHSANEQGFKMPTNRFRFFSPHVSSAQRLLNGNTLITEGADGRIIEVTKENKIAWEYISPYIDEQYAWDNMIYRAYRVPYEWVPQLDKPEEVALPDIDISQFHIRGKS